MIASPHAHRRICLRCRAAMPEHARCDLPGHDTVVLDAAGRARLVEAVWGDRARRDEVARARARHRRVRASGGLAGGMIAGVATVVVAPAQLLVWGTALAGAAVGSVVADALARGGAGASAGVPLVAEAPPVGAPRGRARIVRAPDLASPASDVWCAAWAIELWGTWRGEARLMLRDAWTDGLELELDGGGRARVPAGPWRPAGELVTLVDTDERALDEHLRAIDPDHQPEAELDPLHHDAVHEAVLQVGDHVELCGAWRPELAAPMGEDGLYRDAPPTVLVPDGWPVLRRLRG